MVSVLSSVLTHSLRRAVSGDPHNSHDEKHAHSNTPAPLHTLQTPHTHLATFPDSPSLLDGKIIPCLAGRCVCFGYMKPPCTAKDVSRHQYQDQISNDEDWEVIQPLQQTSSINSAVLTQYPIVTLTSQDTTTQNSTSLPATLLSTSQYTHSCSHLNSDHEDNEEEWCLSDEDLPNISDFGHHTTTRSHVPPLLCTGALRTGLGEPMSTKEIKRKVSWKLSCTEDDVMSGDEGEDEGSDGDVDELTWPGWSAGGVAEGAGRGSSGRASVGWRRRQRQCVRNYHSDRTPFKPQRLTQSSHAVTMEPRPPNSTPGPSSTTQRGQEGAECRSGQGDSAGVVPGFVREDIRDFDIYKILRPDGDGVYPRLPELLPHSDSDTDEAPAEKTVLRRRKRRNPEEREAAKVKRTREPSLKRSDVTYPECPILAPSTSSRPPSHNPHTATPSPSQKPREDEDDPTSDATMHDDDDDDDDEASTVVPDDFNHETDSDIEVLSRSGESWVDLSNQQPGSPDRVAPLPFGNGEEYLRLLREAQRESNQSSARVSLASSRRDTPRDSPHDSPKSPPNSPNTEMATGREEVNLKGVYINYYNKEGDFVRVEKNTETDWIWDWSSRPDQTPPKEWRFSHPRRCGSRGASIRRVMVGNSSLFSRDVLYTLLITNVLSLIIGTGIGIWLSKRSGGGGVVTLPIN